MPDDYTRWSPIKLKPSWKRDDDEYTLTVTKMIAGTLQKEKCPQDNGTKGFEHLIAVTFPGFEKVATRLQFTGAERFQNFEDVLAGNVVVQWRQVMRTWRAIKRTLARFPRALQALLVGL